jgi:hypothetical protein
MCISCDCLMLKLRFERSNVGGNVGGSVCKHEGAKSGCFKSCCQAGESIHELVLCSLCLSSQRRRGHQRDSRHEVIIEITTAKSPPQRNKRLRRADVADNIANSSFHLIAALKSPTSLQTQSHQRRCPQKFISTTSSADNDDENDQNVFISTTSSAENDNDQNDFLFQLRPAPRTTTTSSSGSVLDGKIQRPK